MNVPFWELKFNIGINLILTQKKTPDIPEFPVLTPVLRSENTNKKPMKVIGW
jgi:hypothetical protein